MHRKKAKRPRRNLTGVFRGLHQKLAGVAGKRIFPMRRSPDQALPDCNRQEPPDSRRLFCLRQSGLSFAGRLQMKLRLLTVAFLAPNARTVLRAAPSLRTLFYNDPDNAGVVYIGMKRAERNERVKPDLGLPRIPNQNHRERSVHLSF
ncbi:hypothetical protein [Caballeronia sordidicola]|uniref:hypothetical protein n=1 Tax=Caballeronia sordidicola TaxID=196367 RepID=UPI0012FE75D7|nr:hypothetical protein [Caballeronia sordidicola]